MTHLATNTTGAAGDDDDFILQFHSNLVLPLFLSARNIDVSRYGFYSVRRLVCASSLPSKRGHYTDAHDKRRPPRQTQAYGWVIVAVMLLIQTVSSGLGFYNMSVYINRLSAELAAPVAHVSFAVSLFFVAGGVAGLYM